MPIADLIARAVAGTVEYLPDAALPEVQHGPHATVMEVVNATTLSAARHLLGLGLRPAALNFASATSPGGGFLDGARAQEEYLARSSGLYACLRGRGMYAFHRAHYDPLYSDYVIYSPDVPVFRGEDGALLEVPYTVTMITSPAVNAAKLRPERLPEAGPAMRGRILKVLATGLRHGHDSLVLGAWGCGAFKNDPEVVADLFAKALAQNFAGAYRHILFAITDWSHDGRNIGPFARRLQPSGQTAV